METQLRRLRLIFRLTFLEPKMFYIISFSESDINLQGRFSSMIAKRLKGGEISTSGFLTYSSRGITVTLTD